MTLDVIVRIEEYPTAALTGVAGPSGLLRETGRGNRFEAIGSRDGDGWGWGQNAVSLASGRLPSQNFCEIKWNFVTTITSHSRNPS